MLITHPRRRNQQGATLIEILVTLVILLFGLLGLVGVSSRANQSELESYQRVQALQLVQDMASRINANRKVAACYSNAATGVTLGIGIDPATAVPACTLGTNTQQAQAVDDLRKWDSLIKGAAEADGAKALGAPIGAVGCITLDDATNQIYLIAVAWQGLAPTAAPTLGDGSAFPCGKNNFTNAAGTVDERLHRVITTKVRIGKLS